MAKGKRARASHPERAQIPHREPPGGTDSLTSAVGAERNPIRRFLKIIGPGFISSCADDDPSGIGTYATAGASLGFATLWTALLTFPLMAGVQLVCAKIGMVTGNGLAGVLRQHYPRWLLYSAVVALFVANTINVGADLGGPSPPRSTSWCPPSRSGPSFSRSPWRSLPSRSGAPTGSSPGSSSG